MKKNQTYQLPFWGRLILTGLFGFSLIVAVLIGAGFISPRQSAQEKMTGEWFADFSRKNQDEVQFTTIHRTTRGNTNNSGNRILLSQLQGLTREQAFGAKNDVRFRLVREAGTFDCEGFFKEGRGDGHWSLTVSPSFVSAMRERGYNTLTAEDLYSAARFDITLKSVDDLKSAGYDRLTFKELFEAHIFNVTSEFVRELKSAGYENLSFKQLVEARIFEIDSQFVKEAQALGFGEKLPLKSLVEMRIHEITPEFIREMRSAGFENLSLKELIELSVHQVTPEFVNEIKGEGFSSISPQQAVELKIHGIDRDFIRRVKAKGFVDVTLKQLINLRIQEIVN